MREHDKNSMPAYCGKQRSLNGASRGRVKGAGIYSGEISTGEQIASATRPQLVGVRVALVVIQRPEVVLDSILTDLLPEPDTFFDGGSEVDTDHHARVGVLIAGLRQSVEAALRAGWRRRERHEAEFVFVGSAEPPHDLGGSSAQDAVGRRVVLHGRGRPQ